MQRREVIRLLLGTAALPLLPREVFALLSQVHNELPATPALKTLNPHQDATVTTMAELIIPQTETPGAKAVRVNEFIDLILTEWCDDEDRTKFLAGLANVDTQSRDLFGKRCLGDSQFLGCFRETSSSCDRAEVLQLPQADRRRACSLLIHRKLRSVGSSQSY